MGLQSRQNKDPQNSTYFRYGKVIQYDRSDNISIQLTSFEHGSL